MSWVKLNVSLKYIYQIQISTKISTTIMLNVSISHNMYNVQELHSGGGKTPGRFEMG